MDLSRRAFQVGLGGALLLTAGGLFLGFQPSALIHPKQPLKVLTPRQFSILTAVSDRIQPGNPTASEVGVAEAIDALMATAHPAFARDLGMALLLLENGLTGLALAAQPKPFTRCTPAQQDRILRSWKGGKLDLQRQIYRSLVSLCSAVYWGFPETWPQTGYPGPPPRPR